MCASFESYFFSKKDIGVCFVIPHHMTSFERKLTVTVPGGYYAVLVQDNGGISYYHNTSNEERKVGFTKQYFPEMKLPFLSFLPFVCKEIKGKLYLVKDKFEVIQDLYVYNFTNNGKKVFYKGYFTCEGTVEDPLVPIRHFYNGPYLKKVFNEEYNFMRNHVNMFQNVRTVAVIDSLKKCMADGLKVNSPEDRVKLDRTCHSYCKNVVFPNVFGSKPELVDFQCEEFTY